ncbi:MAG: DJ-1/PfpI family protein [Candidatus Woesearchaeota archaeon]
MNQAHEDKTIMNQNENAQETTKKVLSIIAQRGFQDHEYSESKKALEDAGITVITAAPETKPAIGKFETEIIPDKALHEINYENYDAIITIGGPGALSLGDHLEYFKIITQANNAGKVIGAICIAPVLLGKAGLLKLRRATVWNADGMQSAIIERDGAQYTGETVTTDGNIITADGPASAKIFGEAIAKALLKTKKDE